MASKDQAAAGRAGMGATALIASMAVFSLITLGGTYAILRYTVPGARPAAAHAEAPAVPRKQNPTYPLDQFIINLGNPNDRRFLKTSVTVEIDVPNLDLTKLKGEALHKALEEFRKEHQLHDAAFKDAVIAVLSRKRVAEVSAPEGKAALKAEILHRLNEDMHGEEKVVQVYFTDYIVQ